MSASDKKKLRKEQEAAALTERQKAEQAEAKKLKVITVSFIVIIALIVAATVGIMVSRGITRSGVIQKNTVAATIDGEKLDTVELSYYYMDYVNNFYTSLSSNYGNNAAAYALMLYGVDLTKPLDEQVYNEETGETWADAFIDQALINAKSTYALYNEAMKNGFTIGEDETAAISNNTSTLSTYAALYGYRDLNSYLTAMYGPGANEKSYTDYYTMNTVAFAYQNDYSTALTYDDAALRAHESEDFHAFSSFSYDIYTVYVSSYLGEGTKDEDGNVTYTDEQRDNAEAEAKKVADSLIADCATTADVDAKIAALSEDEDSTQATTKYTDRLSANIPASIVEWMAAEVRADNDMTVIPYSNVSTDEHGHETESLVGYYVVVYHGVNENNITLPDVRHILVEFEGGTKDSTTNVVTYSDAEKAAAKAEAQALLDQWKAGEMTEESFAALANEKSDDGNGTTGGLYEDILPGYMVESFENWCFGDHKPGDTGLVESEYGWHVMYFVSAGDITYRDFMITEELRSADVEKWYNELVEAVTVTEGNLSKMNTSLVLANG